MGMMSKIIFLLLICLSSTGFAQNWQMIGQNPHYQISLNLDSIHATQREGQNLLQVWSNWQVYTEQGPGDELRGDFTMVLYLINCQNDSIAERSRTRYFGNGQERDSKATTWREPQVAPNYSIGASIIQRTCAVYTAPDLTSESFNAHI